MKVFLLLMVLGLLVWSCKKDEVKPVKPIERHVIGRDQGIKTGLRLRRDSI